MFALSLLTSCTARQRHARAGSAITLVCYTAVSSTFVYGCIFVIAAADCVLIVFSARILIFIIIVVIRIHIGSYGRSGTSAASLAWQNTARMMSRLSWCMYSQFIESLWRISLPLGRVD